MNLASPRSKWRRPALSYGGLVLVLATAAQAHMAAGSQGIPVLGLFIQRELDLTRAQLGLLVATAQVGAALAFFFGGWLSDALGVRLALVLGLGGLGASFLGLTTGTSLAAALPFLFVAGIGNGLASPPLSLAVTHWLPFHARAMAMGVKQTGVPIAGIVLASGLPFIAEALGWRGGAALVGGAVLLMAGVWWLAYRDAPGQRYGQRSRSPLAAAALLRHPGLLSISLFAAAAVAAQFSLLSYLMLFLHEQRAFPVVLAGLVLAAAQLGGLFGRLAWGIVSDRVLHGARKPALCGAGALGALALVALAYLPVQVPAVAVATALALGLTLLSWQGLHQVAVVELARPGQSGQTLGMSMMVLHSGAIVGPPLIGLLVDRTGSYELAWLALAAVVALGVAAMALGWQERAARG